MTAEPAVAVAAPQWRISTDRRAAARLALAAGADLLQLDFGGAHRGPLLSGRSELRSAEAITKDIPIPVLAVNHVNDIGLAHPWGSANPAALILLERALECAQRLGHRCSTSPVSDGACRRPRACGRGPSMPCASWANGSRRRG